MDKPILNQQLEKYGKVLRISEDGRNVMTKDWKGVYWILFNQNDERWKPVDSWNSLEAIQKFWTFHTGEKID